MILYGVLAAASRHQAIWMDQGEHEAEFYHGLSLRLVIEALSASETTYDDDLLVAVVLLRVHEEIAQSTDRYLHLHGMSRLLASIPTFAHSGGLAEAACWLSLRQDLFVSLTIGQRPTLVLEHYDQSSAFKFRDDGACANVIILILAKILRLVYSAESQLEEEWALLEGDVVRWNDRRAKLFRPIFEEDLDLNKNRPFPVICMINAPQGKLCTMLSQVSAEILTDSKLWLFSTTMPVKFSFYFTDLRNKWLQDFTLHGKDEQQM